MSAEWRTLCAQRFPRSSASLKSPQSSKLHWFASYQLSYLSRVISCLAYPGTSEYNCSRASGGCFLQPRRFWIYGITLDRLIIWQGLCNFSIETKVLCHYDSFRLGLRNCIRLSFYIRLYISLSGNVVSKLEGIEIFNFNYLYKLYINIEKE